MEYVAERIAASCDHGQTASHTCQEYTGPPAPGKSASCLRRRGERYSMGFAHHGWHHEPYSPVKNSRCKRWDTPVFLQDDLLPGRPLYERERPGPDRMKFMEMFQTCGSATLSESERTINASEGSD